MDNKCLLLKGALVSVGFPADEDRLAAVLAFLKRYGILSFSTFGGASSVFMFDLLRRLCVAVCRC